MKNTDTPLRRWMAIASTPEQQELASASGISRTVLYQYATRHRFPDAARAARIESAATKLAKRNPLLPPLTRGDLNPTCAACPFYKSCGVKR